MCKPKVNAMVILLFTCTAWLQFSRTCPGDDSDLISGKWRLASWKSDHAEYNVKDLDHFSWVFDRERLRVLRDGDEQVSLRIRLNETARPKEFDLWYDGDDPKLKLVYPAGIHGIYEIDGDKLRRCYTFGQDPRPKTFEAEPGSRNWLQVLERVQPAPDKGV
jgi:uncharacterized protein (TIGR03067 family)